MHQELVERRRWVAEGRFLHALNFCMLLPGPEAQQLATYVGWRLHGTKGGIAAGASGIACGVIRNNYFQPAMRALMAVAVASALPPGDCWMTMPEAVTPFRREELV
mgnify:CR=1 FL=1